MSEDLQRRPTRWEILRRIPGFLNDLRCIRQPMAMLIFALNRLFFHTAGGEQRPKFFAIGRTFPALLEFERHFGEIQAELEKILLDRESIPKYHEIDPGEYHISGVGDPDKHWRVFVLKALGGEPVDNLRRCPVTSRLLDGLRGRVWDAWFSILEPGKCIPPHCGPYLGFLKYHLALKVPNERPPRIRVADQWYTWVEGEAVLFDDSWEHEVFNDSEQLRVVLIINVMRPMPWLQTALNRFARYMLRRSSYHQQVLERAMRH